MTTTEDITLRDTLISLIEEENKSLHIEHLTNIDPEVPGAEVNDSGFFWVLKDERGEIIKGQRLVVSVVGDFRESEYTSPAKTIDELNDDVVKRALVLLLNEIRDERKKAAKMKYLGEYDFSQLANLIGES